MNACYHCRMNTALPTLPPGTRTHRRPAKDLKPGDRLVSRPWSADKSGVYVDKVLEVTMLRLADMGGIRTRVVVEDPSRSSGSHAKLMHPGRTCEIIAV